MTVAFEIILVWEWLYIKYFKWGRGDRIFKDLLRYCYVGVARNSLKKGGMDEMPVFLKQKLNGSAQKWLIRTLVTLLIGMAAYNWNIMRSDMAFVQARYVNTDQYRIDCIRAENERSRNTERIEDMGKSINSTLSVILDKVSDIKVQVAKIEGRGHGK